MNAIEEALNGNLWLSTNHGISARLTKVPRANSENTVPMMDAEKPSRVPSTGSITRATGSKAQCTAQSIAPTVPRESTQRCSVQRGGAAAAGELAILEQYNIPSRRASRVIQCAGAARTATAPR